MMLWESSDVALQDKKVANRKTMLNNKSTIGTIATTTVAEPQPQPEAESTENVPGGPTDQHK